MSSGGITGSAWGTRLSTTVNARPAKSATHHRARFTTTPEQVKEVMYLRERRGWSAGRIATKTGLPVSTINSIFSGNGARTVEVGGST